MDATQAPFAAHWRMESYVAAELPALLRAHLAAELDCSRMGISGHSMGGMGALALGFKHPGLFRVVTAFSPIAHPSACPWGRKAFAGYLGADEAAWAAADPTALVRGYKGAERHIRVDMGLADEWLEKGQLLPDDFLAAAKDAGVAVDYRAHAGYDHSFYFVGSFIAEHIAWHAKWLQSAL